MELIILEVSFAISKIKDFRLQTNDLCQSQSG